MPARLAELGVLGVQLAVDDFGAEYSSLAELPQLPLDIVKIDKAFVDAIGSPEGRVFARKIIELAHALDLRVIAEGVQTHEEFEELRKARCELGQGYYFAQPVDNSALPGLRAELREPSWAAPSRR